MLAASWAGWLAAARKIPSFSFDFAAKPQNQTNCVFMLLVKKAFAGATALVL
jgi:hypothetical protein